MNGKYRVYDKQEKRYVTDEWMWVIRPDGTLAYVDHDDVIGYLDAIAEYSTGLPDKNGREIFEGDVVECVSLNEFFSINGNPMEQMRRKMAVVFHDGAFMMEEKFPYDLKPAYWPLICNGDIEIISSIHDTQNRGPHDV